MESATTSLEIARKLCRAAGVSIGKLICGYRKRTGQKAWTIQPGSMFEFEPRVRMHAIKLMLPILASENEKALQSGKPTTSL